MYNKGRNQETGRLYQTYDRLCSWCCWHVNWKIIETTQICQYRN